MSFEDCLDVHRWLIAVIRQQPTRADIHDCLNLLRALDRTEKRDLWRWLAEHDPKTIKRRRVWVEPDEVVPDEGGCPDTRGVVPQPEILSQQSFKQNSSSGQPGQPGQPPNEVVPKVVQPETLDRKDFQQKGTMWTTSNPKRNKKISDL